MTTNKAAEHLRDYLIGVEDSEELAALLDAALAHERSAGAAPIDVEPYREALEWAIALLSVEVTEWDSRSKARMAAGRRLLDAAPTPSAEADPGFFTSMFFVPPTDGEPR